MTLKEKFYPYCDNEYFDKWVSAEYCEDVADDFAVGFAEWYRGSKNNEYHLYPKASIEEHLEIYKKEKGL